MDLNPRIIAYKALPYTVIYKYDIKKVNLFEMFSKKIFAMTHQMS